MSISTYPIIGYHGCDARFAARILRGDTNWLIRKNYYDWLGKGVYFWVGSYNRALAWAIDKHKDGRISAPGVIGAVIDLGHCLNLTDYGVSQELTKAYASLSRVYGLDNLTLPVNEITDDPLVPTERYLDCAIVNHIHDVRADNNMMPYDTVLGAFDEGGPAYPGGAIWEKSHIQVAVVNTSCIKRLF